MQYSLIEVIEAIEVIAMCALNPLGEETFDPRGTAQRGVCALRVVGLSGNIYVSQCVPSLSLSLSALGRYELLQATSSYE